MKKIVSVLLSLILSISTILFCAGNIYSVKAEEVSINSFIEDGLKLIRENDVGKEFIPEIIEDKTIEKAESESLKRTVTKASSNDKEEFSDTTFQTCRLIVKASKTPDKLNSIGMASGFRDWYIIQFETVENTKAAYHYYLKKDETAKVTPDAVHQREYYSDSDDTNGETNNSSDLSGTIGRLNSWGSINTGLYDVKDYIEANVLNQQEIVVGLIDSGINYNLEYFDGRIIRTYANYSGTGDENDEMEQTGHGTKVASLIVDNTSPNVKIATYCNGDYIGMESESALAILDAISDNVDILNCSFGETNKTGLLGEVLDFAHEHDIPVIAAGGNWSVNIRLDSASWPACDVKSISVGGFSNSGSPATWATYGKEIDLLAPCENLLCVSDESGRAFEESGTSFSAPLVVSLFTQMMTLYPEMSNEEIEHEIKSSADVTDMFYDSELFGYGVIDAIGATGIQRLNTPVFDKKSGKYIDEITVTITADSGSEIYYTLDGSYPSKEKGLLYTEPVKIVDDCPFLKAVAYKNGCMRSDMARSLYRMQRLGTDDMFTISDNGQILSYTGDVFDLIIPEMINGVTVNSIAPNVFSESDLAGVSFPDSLTEVSESAFENNKSLMLADGENIKTICRSAFQNCQYLTLINFPAVESVGDDAFHSCSALPGIELPKCIEIGFNSFCGCNNMRCIILPETRVLIGNSFKSCTMLSDVFLPKLEELRRTANFNGDFIGCEFCDVLDLPQVKATHNGTFSKTFMKRLEFSQVRSIHRLGITGIRKDDFDAIPVLLVLPSTLEEILRITEGTNYIVYGTKGTYVEQWANENEFEFIEITPETAVITDLTNEFYDYMRYLEADVVGFNRTYQWYGSYFDRNTGGIPIEGANERKFVPKDNEQYPYYYCVVTSNDVGYDPIEIRTGASKYMEFNGEMPNADYFALDEILATVPEDISIYTDESAAALNEIINNIDRNLDVSNQATVDGYVEAISNALSALKLKGHMVSFIVDNESVLSYELEYGSEITDIPPNPDKIGYTFSNWTLDIPPAMPNNPLVFTAEFEPVTYYASFMVDGEEIEKVPFNVESESISEPAIPVKEGYTGKWSDYIIAASDITVNAEYTINEYTVSFVADDKTVKSETVKYGSKIEIPDAPQKKGYIFKEWLPKVPETMPAEDMTFYAVFEEEKQPEIKPEVGIRNFVNSRTVDYRTTITFTAAADNMPEGTTIIWYKDGQRAGTGEKFTVKEAREAFTVQAKIVDESGNILDSTETELVKVKTDFFSKIIAFFRMLFGKLPVIEQ